MKRAVILIILFLLVIGAGIGEHFYVHKTFDEFDSRMHKIEDFIDNENGEDALASTVDLQTWWLDKKEVLESISYCNEARQVNVIIGELQGSLEIGDLDNASSKIISLYQLINNIRDTLDFNAQDII